MFNIDWLHNDSLTVSNSNLVCRTYTSPNLPLMTISSNQISTGCDGFRGGKIAPSAVTSTKIATGCNGLVGKLPKKNVPYASLVPERILRSGPATIVFWRDGTKTIVKRAPDEPDNAYAAFTAALGIKAFGSNSALKRIVERYTEEQKK